VNQEEFDALNGRVSALSAVLNSVIQTLPQELALQAAANLARSQLEMAMDDQSNGDTPAAEAAARNTILDGYGELLKAVGLHAR
jgi:hypothetical protein